MAKSYKESIDPLTEDLRIKKALKDIIEAVIKVYAKHNQIDEQIAVRLFCEKIDGLKINIEDDKFLKNALSKTYSKMNLEEPEVLVENSVCINEKILDQKDDLKFAICKECFEIILSDDKLRENDDNMQFNRGCYQITYIEKTDEEIAREINEKIEEKKKIDPKFVKDNYSEEELEGLNVDEYKTKEKGKMLHEVLVYRMQKDVCKKLKIKMSDEHLKGDYEKSEKLIKKLEKIKGFKMYPSQTMQELESFFGKEEILKFADKIDEKDYFGCDKIINEIEEEEIESSKKYPAIYIQKIARKYLRETREKVRKLLLKNSNTKLLEAPKEIDEKDVDEFKEKYKVNDTEINKINVFDRNIEDKKTEKDLKQDEEEK